MCLWIIIYGCVLGDRSVFFSGYGVVFGFCIFFVGCDESI